MNYLPILFMERNRVLWYREQLKNQEARKALLIMVLICEIMHLAIRVQDIPHLTKCLS